MINFIKLPVEALERMWNRHPWRHYKVVFRDLPSLLDPIMLSQPEPENSQKRDRTADPVAGSALGINLPYVCPSCAQPSSCRPQDHPGAYLCENPQCGVFLFLPKI